MASYDGVSNIHLKNIYPPFAILYQDPPAPTRDAARIVVALPAVLNEELEWARDIPVLSMHGMREWMGKRVSEKLEKLGARAKEVVGGHACCTSGVLFPIKSSENTTVDALPPSHQPLKYAIPKETTAKITCSPTRPRQKKSNPPSRKP